MSDLPATLLIWLAATSCQLLVPFVAALLIDRTLGARAWPEFRAAIWSLVALKLLIPPTLGTAWHAPLAAITTPPPVVLETANAWHDWILGFWAGGAMAWLAIATAAQRRALRSAHADAAPMPGPLLAELQALAAQVGLRRLPRVLLTNAGLGTFVHANPRQQLVIDRAQLAALPPEARRHLLLHELMHLRRRDALWALTGTLLQAVFWFHPLTWLLFRRLHALRELCCDQSVVRVLGGDPHAYRGSLLQAARCLLQTAPARQHAFTPWGSLALQRLRALEHPRRTGAKLRLSISTVAVGMFAIACVPLAQLPFDPTSVAINDLQGCLQRRFVVLAALANAEAKSAAPPTSHQQETVSR